MFKNTVRPISEFTYERYMEASGLCAVPGTGWLMLDDSLNSTDACVVLISQHRMALTSFTYERRSGTDHQRQRCMALLWAEQNKEIAPCH